MAGIDYAALKKGGFLRQKQENRFSLRLRAVGGQFSSAQMKKIVEVAEKFGESYIHITSRQGVEIPFIKLDDIEKVKEALGEAGLAPGICGAKVRSITACQGKAICLYGLIETTELAKKLDKRYCGRDLPNKLKIGITGCPNNCLKVDGNDFGIKGAALPQWDEGKCDACGLCETVCPANAIVLEDNPGDKAEGAKIKYDASKCIHCGKCVQSCPENAWTGKNGYLLSFGGTFGREIKTGEHLLPIIFSEDEVLRIADSLIGFFEKNAKPGERLGKLISRIGAEKLKAELLSQG